MDDVTLTRKVETEIFRPKGAPKGKVDVNAVDGVVWLRGEVKNQSAEQVDRDQGPGDPRGQGRREPAAPAQDPGAEPHPRRARRRRRRRRSRRPSRFDRDKTAKTAEKPQVVEPRTRCPSRPRRPAPGASRRRSAVEGHRGARHDERRVADRRHHDDARGRRPDVRLRAAPRSPGDALAGLAVRVAAASVGLRLGGVRLRTRRVRRLLGGGQLLARLAQLVAARAPSSTRRPPERARALHRALGGSMHPLGRLGLGLRLARRPRAPARARPGTAASRPVPRRGLGGLARRRRPSLRPGRRPRPARAAPRGGSHRRAPPPRRTIPSPTAARSRTSRPRSTSARTSGSAAAACRVSPIRSSTSPRGAPARARSAGPRPRARGCATAARSASTALRRSPGRPRGAAATPARGAAPPPPRAARAPRPGRSRASWLTTHAGALGLREPLDLCGVVLLPGGAQLAGQRVAARDELVERQPVELVGGLLERLAHHAAPAHVRRHAAPAERPRRRTRARWRSGVPAERRRGPRPSASPATAAARSMSPTTTTSPQNDAGAAGSPSGASTSSRIVSPTQTKPWRTPPPGVARATQLEPCVVEGGDRAVERRRAHHHDGRCCRAPFGCSAPAGTGGAARQRPAWEARRATRRSTPARVQPVDAASVAGRPHDRRAESDRSIVDTRSPSPPRPTAGCRASTRPAGSCCSAAAASRRTLPRAPCL